ncbi:MAG TPA: peptide chain release factor N(5)-glutamine methyltransferase, partial [Candidatus Cloacimonadota bacterium]|nr:peptide chain release factor N(5)-glutamine methyltransferase [Candidatus Cloacimonadota bacterium]
FYGLEFRLTKAVLIPRQDTEVLVERGSKRLAGTECVLDIGTGSGIIAIALARLFPQLRVHATDIDAEALEVAKANAIRLDTKVSFFKADLYPEEKYQYDLIISNPPYISSSDYAALDVRVRNFEPRQALWGGADGLQYYRRILAGAERYLKPDGFLALEHGYDQRVDLADLAMAAGLEVLESGKDLAGHDRYMILTRVKSRG